MSLKSASTDILMQLAEVVGQLADDDYARPLSVLSGNTIGKHVRHILEFYELLVASIQMGQLNYDRRQRDLRLEVDTDEALRRIGAVDRTIHRIDLNQPLILTADLSVKGNEVVQIPSSIARELLYNIEHAIHHMALIQIAIQNDFPAVDLPMHFGVAYSTVQHQSK
ncbi:DinB family protein [Spirosoma aerolatum]|uniref:DinB family protein n=1 Tax=Spirosoma aerolatum TaxID=1211326 RepID=UPI0009AD77C5|nr:DinB family protein [Spirosoma aerolatum]